MIKKFLISFLIWPITVMVAIGYMFKVFIKRIQGEITPTYATRCFNQFSRITLKIVRASYQIKVKQPIHFDSERIYIFMSNHLANYDFPLILSTIPGHIRFVAKKELLTIPLFGRALAYCDIFCLDRKNPLQAAKDFQEIKTKAHKKKLHLWVFPEGTRSISGELLPLKAGVFRLAKELDGIIIPVGIKGTQHILPARSLLFGKLGQKISIQVGEPIDTNHYDLKELPKLTREVANVLHELII